MIYILDQKENTFMVKSNNKLNKSHKMGLWKVSALIVLSILMLSSGLMIAKLNANVGVATASVGVQSSSLDISGSTGIGGSAENGIGGETSSVSDFTDLAYKYYDYFVQNSDGTYRLDITNIAGRTGLRSIESSDFAMLEQYSKMIDENNKMKADGTLTQGADGNWYLSDTEQSSRTLIGGRNQFYIVSKKIWFIWVDVGYGMDLSVANTVVFGAVMEALYGAFKPSNSVLTSLESFRTWFQQYIIWDSTNEVQIILQKAYDILSQVIIYGSALKTALAYIFGSTIANILDMFLNTVLGWLVGGIYNKISKPMTNEATKVFSLTNPTNTVKCETDLIFSAFYISSYQY